MSKPTRRMGILALAAIALLVGVGCTSLPPAQSARDFKAIAGRWEGAVVLRNSRHSLPAAITIQQDGRWLNFIPSLNKPGPRFVGTLAIVDGKYRYKSETTGGTGTYTLHEGEGKRVLTISSDDGNVTGEFRPAR
jgi:hypothetical protein